VARRLRAGLRRHGVAPRPVELAHLLRSADVRLSAGNVLELYRDGRSGLSAMLEAIRMARRRVHLETYILRADETGRRFLEALRERAQVGVEVRVLYDAVGCRGLDPRVLEPLRQAGADIVAFNPLGRFYPRWAPRRRDHRKILVVDGEIAFTGGLNIGDEYLLGPAYDGGPRVPWRDAHLRVVGPAVALLEAVFLESWFRADGPDSPWTALLAEGAAPARPEGDAVGLLPDGPTYHRRRMREVLVGALARTQDTARLVTPYFLPGVRLRRALAQAARRGVRVEVLIAGYSDHPILRWAAHARAPALLAEGVRVFEYRRAMMHAKLAVFDGSWAILGSSNLDRQSLQHSYEVNLIVGSGALPGRLAATIDEDLADAVELTPELLAERSPGRRLRDWIAAFVIGRW
jgi:cardiolipin synthase